jgi:hypothetical protein
MEAGSADEVIERALRAPKDQPLDGEYRLICRGRDPWSVMTTPPALGRWNGFGRPDALLASRWQLQAQLEGHRASSTLLLRRAVGQAASNGLLDHRRAAALLAIGEQAVMGLGAAGAGLDVGSIRPGRLERRRRTADTEDRRGR